MRIALSQAMAVWGRCLPPPVVVGGGVCLRALHLLWAGPSAQESPASGSMLCFPCPPSADGAISIWVDVKPCRSVGAQGLMVIALGGYRRDSGGMLGQWAVITSQDAGFNAPELLEGDGSDGDCVDDDVAEQIEMLKSAQDERRKQQRERQVKATEYLRKLGKGPSSSSSKVASSGGGGPKPRHFVAMPCRGPSLEDAKQWLPPGATLSKDCVRENRWRIRFKPLGGEKSKSFGRHSSTNEWESLVVLLQQAWRAHERVSGEACPFSFECSAA